MAFVAAVCQLWEQQSDVNASYLGLGLLYVMGYEKRIMKQITCQIKCGCVKL
jgi:hypothetical protein